MMTGSRGVSLGGRLVGGLAGEVECFTSLAVGGVCGDEGCTSVVAEGWIIPRIGGVLRLR